MGRFEIWYSKRVGFHGGGSKIGSIQVLGQRICDAFTPFINRHETEYCNESRHLVPYTGSGPDAESNRIRDNQTPRFDVHDEVVTDRATGLIWNLNASPATFPMDWTETFEYVGRLNRSGYHGIGYWQLTNIRYLK